MEGEEDKAFHELELVEEMMKVVVSWKTEVDQILFSQMSSLWAPIFEINSNAVVVIDGI